MSSSQSASSVETPTPCGGRYVLEEPIGRGGMASVYRALDTTSGQRVALKKLEADDRPERTQHRRELFEREFHALAQLAHPRIVAAFDYGLEGELPYYTMELLDGGDLLERSPLPWHNACAVARDVCSALSLVHSRRMVYRDLSARNVRCTSDGKAKLIDFGAMAPMGPNQLAVCTPAVAAPEVVHRQPLDGRSDLYALGATLYFTLTRRNPYPARSFAQLLESWQHPPRAPSTYVPDIPEALDALIMDLLQLDPQLRPANAAEISQRLCAIAGLESDEQLLVSQAYLTTPTLVGRDRELALIERMSRRLLEQGKGSAMLVRGPSGVGRSRFIDACMLGAKVAGVAVARIAAADALQEPYGAVQALVDRLLEMTPRETAEAERARPDRDVLRTLLPALWRQSPQQPPDEAVVQDTPAKAQAALRDFVLDIAARKPLLIAIDDVERLDAESAALMALLAHQSRAHPLILLATAGSNDAADGSELQLLAGACAELELRPLTRQQTRALLASVFGDVPNLEVLVRRMHTLAAGNPRDLMRLAQHLLDHGTVSYREGAWVLPDRVEDEDLPATVAQAFEATVAGLDDDTRSLAQALAQCPEQRFSLDECIALSAHADRARVFDNLDRLGAASIVNVSGERFALASNAWVPALSASVKPEVHRRLAGVFEQRGDGLRAARHLFFVGEQSEGLDLLVPYSEQSQRWTNSSSGAYVKFLSTLPQDWLQILQSAIALCQEHRRPARDLFALRRRLCSIISQTSVCSEGQQAALAGRLAYDVGLDLYAALDPDLPAPERLRRALSEAKKRYDAAPECERMFEPEDAIPKLTHVTVSAIGSFSRTLDVEEWAQMPSLAPLSNVSPAVALVARLAEGFDARVRGRSEDACAIYYDTLRLLDRHEGEGLDRMFSEAMRAGLSSIIGTLEAVLGLPSSERWADQAAAIPLYHGSAFAIRLLNRLWQGDDAGAERLGRERALWQLEQPRQQVSDVVTVLWMLQAHALSDDLTRTRHDLEAIERTASRIGTWQPIAAWARGEYERIRGDHEAALAALDVALERLEPGQHQGWPLAAAARLRVLCEQARYAEARQEGARAVAAAQASGLGYVVSYLRMPLAVAEAHLGDGEAAWSQARAAIDSFEGLGATGLNPGLAYETAAYVAAQLGDHAAFETYADLCKTHFLAHDNAALGAKYRRLVRAAQRVLDLDEPDVVADSVETLMSRSQIESALLRCATKSERLQRALELLLEVTGAQRGFFYCIEDDFPALRVQTHAEPLPPEVEAGALSFLARELSDEDMSTAASVTDSSFGGQWPIRAGECYRPVMLHHEGPRGLTVSGLVMLAYSCDRGLRAAGSVACHLSRILEDCGDLGTRVVAS